MSNVDLARYYDESYPPSLWGGPVVVPATGAAVGFPGIWTPAGSQAPATVADLAAGVPNGVVASPPSAWPVDSYVQTRTAGAAGSAHWNGTAWAPGPAGASADPTSSWLKAEIVAWLLAHGVTLDEAALEQLTKAELLELVADLVNPPEPEGEALPPPEYDEAG